MACGRQKTEQKPGRVESVKECYRTNKALFSMRGACVVQMDGILLHLRGGDFGLGGVHSAWVNPGTGNDLVPAGE